MPVQKFYASAVVSVFIKNGPSFEILEINKSKGMTNVMIDTAIRVAREALDSFIAGEYGRHQKMQTYICEHFSTEHGGEWNCITGRTFGGLMLGDCFVWILVREKKKRVENVIIYRKI